ncbi:hypothetical protein RDI58_013494 [Solanum bulbocastanum]|uniref:Uncharacterized protein n=1 Tax=Solanum bulbocastanum TaxID=147425 RepID=A0AAN8TMZ7_SOLBU
MAIKSVFSYFPLIIIIYYLFFINFNFHILFCYCSINSKT